MQEEFFESENHQRASCKTLAASSFTYVLPQGIRDAQAPEALHSFTKALHSPSEPGAAMSAPALRHVTKISSLSPKEIKGVLKLALEMKASGSA